MKYLLLLLFIPALTFSQKIALLSKDFNKPIIYTDSVTVEQLKNYFPVESASFDTLHACLIELKGMLKQRQRSKMESFDFHAGVTTIRTVREPHAYGDHFNIQAQTKLNEVSSFYQITNAHDNNNNNSKRIDRLLAYMEQNKSLFQSPNEIHPKYYNVIVVTGR